MKEFMGKDFQLDNPTAKILYEKYAKDMPIFDYHCHLVAKDIYENRKFNNLTEVWLVDGNYGDHYKWRLMRANGVDEKYITGSATDEEKFMKWAETVPFTIGNPVYHWVHMELKTFFGITKQLNINTAKEIYQICNKKLETLTTRKMIEMNNVDYICTTDDPTDSLEYHIKLQGLSNFKTKVLPAFRPDKGLNINKDGFIDWIRKLETVVGFKIDNLEDFKKALSIRIEFFNNVGCIVSDHALDQVVYEESTEEEVNEIFIKALQKQHLSKIEIAKYVGYMLVFLGKQYVKYDWVQQYHINAMRNNSKRMLKLLGPDTGFDSVNDSNFAPKLSKILDVLDSTNELPKTILYSLNTKDYETLATIAGCFNRPGVKSLVQLGSAWWFSDQIDGMQKQISTVANMGIICNFVGMLTDSRSFLSYPRHDYFRRILCNYFGRLIENGEYPADIEFVGQVVKNICYNNAKHFFMSEGHK